MPPKKLSLEDQISKVVQERTKVIEKIREKFKEELSSVPSPLENWEIIGYLQGLYVRHNKINYQLPEPVIDEKMIELLTDLLQEENLV